MLPEPTATFTLPDGRLLACDDVGDPGGHPVVYLHGSPDCRLARHPDDGLAAAAGVRLVAVDRPGWGWSDPPAPDLLTFGDELGLLLDDLAVGRCTLAAWSAGMPWALGAAAALGADRVACVVGYGVVAPFESFGDPAVAAASGSRAALAAAVLGGDLTPADLADELAMLLLPSPPVPVALARDQVLETLAPGSVAALGDDVVQALAVSLAASVDRHFDAGLRADLAVQYSPGVEALLAQVACPVVLAHGELDEVSGPAVGRWLAERLADARVDVWEGAGHQGLLADWPRFLTLSRR